MCRASDATFGPVRVQVAKQLRQFRRALDGLEFYIRCAVLVYEFPSSQVEQPPNQERHS